MSSRTRHGSHSVDSSPLTGRGSPRTGSEGVETGGEKTVITSREQEALDQLAMLFTIQEERCLSEAREGAGSKLSRASLTQSQMADASFIYQRIDFDLLSKCVPGFVRTHLNKNGRYLPETFILRVNYLRRRRALGGDSGTDKRAAKESMSRACSDLSSTPRAPPSRGQAAKSAPPVATAAGADTRVSLTSG